MKNYRNTAVWRFLLLLVAISLTAAVVEGATGDIDMGIVYQELEGFGASCVWTGQTLQELGNYNPTIYDVIFSDLGLDILRLRNPYQYPYGDNAYMDRVAEIVADGYAQTGRELKILITSWSPRASLKSNLEVYGGDDATLAGGPSSYVYWGYSDWWEDSLVSWASKGVVAEYISMQNEPDYDAEWDSCRFEPSQTSSFAGYDVAFENLYTRLESSTEYTEEMPKMIAAGATGFVRADNYIDALDDLSHVYGYAHHLYNCYDGGTAGCGSNPDNYISQMSNFGSAYNDKPIFQTEYSDGNNVTTYEACMDLAVLMHNSLVVEGVAAYLYWQLTYNSGQGLVSITETNWTINPVYYAFKHYSAFTESGWHRIDASLSGVPSSVMRMSAYMSPDNDEWTIVIINIEGIALPLTVNLHGFSVDSSEVYQSTSSSYWSYIGSFNPSMTIPGTSITTIHLTGSPFENCAEALAAGDKFASDIYSDCYVNLKDLAVVAQYWLRTDCAFYDDCEGADFEPTDGDVDLDDLDTFTQQWLWCNDPENPNC